MNPESPDQEAEEGLEYKLALTGTFFKLYWKIIFAIVWPILLIPLIASNNVTETRCGFVVLMMAGYWITECFPMAITSLLPVVLFPVFGILNTTNTVSCYMNDTIMVFIGGLILAITIEHSKLHHRIALGVMKTVGCTHGKLLAGFCTVTTLISMWVSNTAATAMMVPIIFAVLEELEQAGLSRVFDKMPVNPENPTEEPELKPTKVTKAYLMAAAYCASFGGTGTFVGTGTNLTFKGIFETTFPGAGGLNFTQWMIAAFPQMVINASLTWLYLQIIFLGLFRPNSKDAQLAAIGAEGEAITNRVIQQRYKELGDITFHETAVACLFLTCVLLWVLRKPGFMPGWSEVITNIDIRDSTPVIFICILMFFIPKDPSFIHSCSRDPTKRPEASSEGLITWNVIQSKMPWSLMFLLGGGFAISRGSVASCLAIRVGGAMLPLRNLNPIVLLLIISLFIGFITEFTSNVGIANITLPIIAQMCVAMEMHPLYLMIPSTLMCSYSFRLPVGTPPNAIITIVGRIPTKWLMIGGCGPSTYALIVANVCFLTWGRYVYDLDEFPAWARDIQSNNTDTRCN